MSKQGASAVSGAGNGPGVKLAPNGAVEASRLDGLRTLVLDNYDSFTYNLVQYLGELGCRLEVHRNDKISVEQIAALDPERIVISPGPGTPAQAGISKAVIETLGARVPVLGVCLGHQCIGEVFGGAVVPAPELRHGKTSWIHHRGDAILQGLPQPFEATRYHSLIVERDQLPDCLQISAWTDDGTIMGLRHRERPIFGVQFHPESILTSCGHDLLRNFLCCTT